MSAWFDSLVAWIGAHPVAAGVAIFLVAFCDAVIILGAIVPALPLLFAIGVLIGLGEISGPYAVACAAAGAFLGDASSYWIGHRWGPRLRATWPFSKYPQLLERAELLFLRNETKGEEYTVLLPLTQRQKGCILCGGLLNFTRESAK